MPSARPGGSGFQARVTRGVSSSYAPPFSRNYQQKVPRALRKLPRGLRPGKLGRSGLPRGAFTPASKLPTPQRLQGVARAFWKKKGYEEVGLANGVKVRMPKGQAKAIRESEALRGRTRTGMGQPTRPPDYRPNPSKAQAWTIAILRIFGGRSGHSGAHGP